MLSPKKKFKNLVFCHKLGLLRTSGLHWVTAVDRSTPPVPPLSQCVWGVGFCLPKAAMHLGSFQGELQQFQAPWRLTAAWGWSRVPLLCPCSPRWAALRRSEGNVTWAFVCIMQFCFKWRWGYWVCSVYYPCISMLAKQECVLARLQTEVGCTLKKCTSLCKRASPGQPSPFLLAPMPVCVSCDLLVGREDLSAVDKRVRSPTQSARPPTSSQAGSYCIVPDQWCGGWCSFGAHHKSPHPFTPLPCRLCLLYIYLKCFR